MTDCDLDIAIVGAGAAGLMAAISAGRRARDHATPLRIAALDGAAKVGAKILVAGGGRCNVTNQTVRPDDLNGGNRHQIAKVLRSFDVPATIRFFRELGLELKVEEDGKLFPVTDRAQTVLDALLRGVAEAGAVIHAGCRVTGVERFDDGFVLHTAQRDLRARCVILATGGLSLPKTGSDGAGYDFARALGHTVTPTFPALVPLLLPRGHWLTALSGISLDVELMLTAPSGKVQHREAGPLLLTHLGVSGPAALNISRHWIAARQRESRASLLANLVPPRRHDDVADVFRQAAARRPTATVATVLRDLVPQRLAVAVARDGAQVDPGTTLAHLTRPQRLVLAQALTALPLPVTGDRGWRFAEVTAGGVPLDEIDPATMASRRCPGLFLCGEMLDVDGRIGGFNFQWAWCTGRLAGTGSAAAAHLTREGRESVT